MKLTFLFFILIVIISGCATPFGEKELSGPDVFRCPYREGRGVIADFVQYAPPDQVREGELFTLGLVFFNMFDEQKNIDLQIQDTTDTPGFPPEGIHENVNIESAVVENERWIEPGCRIDQEEFVEFETEDYAYQSVKFDKDTVQFRGTLTYDTAVDLGFMMCVFNPAQGGNFQCSTEQQYGGNELGLMNTKAPVFLDRVQRTLVGSRKETKVKLTFDVRNGGNGYVGGDGGVDVVLRSSDLAFRCFSDEAASQGTQQLHLILDRDEQVAHVQCETSLTADRLETHYVDFMLQHTYVFPFSSQPMELLQSREG